ncbi:MAG: HAMP domain-containing histidine kinase [Alphaproteobacteria bacterium]|nr:HAMP domain-containing histidine kinase [Alphaproteobacteria bacterium]
MDKEFGALFRGYNAMVRAAGEREALRLRLAEEERLATLGTLAGSMAHEVNNPLGGMLTALDTIAAHGTDARVREQSIGFLRRGLEDIRNVVRASLVLYKARAGPTVLSREALDDLRYLAGPEAARRGVQLAWENAVEAAPVGNATAVRQAVLNLLLNAIAASPPRGTVSLAARHDDGRLIIAVADEGAGLPQSVDAMLSAPDAGLPAGSTGLGLWAATRAVRALGGTIRHEITATGTILVLEIPTEGANAAA